MTGVKKFRKCIRVVDYEIVHSADQCFGPNSLVNLGTDIYLRSDV